MNRLRAFLPQMAAANELLASQPARQEGEEEGVSLEEFSEDEDEKDSDDSEDSDVSEEEEEAGQEVQQEEGMAGLLDIARPKKGKKGAGNTELGSGEAVEGVKAGNGIVEMDDE
jgi:hypothetical protein